MVSASFSEDTLPAAPKIVAAVTAYCDQDALIHTLRAISAQSPLSVAKILVVDNSPTILALPQQSGVPIEHIHLPDNPGLVRAVNTAIEWAGKQQADFLWLFDQDSLPEAECLDRLWQGWQHLHQQGLRPGILGPTIEEAGTRRIHHGYEFLGYRYRMIETPRVEPAGYYLCEMVLHSGSLIRINSSSLLAPLPEWIFLDALEHALAEQIIAQGKTVAVIPAARMLHRYGQPVVVGKKGSERIIQNYATLRYYTICRNQTWFEIRHAKGWINKLRAMLYAIKRCRKLTRNIRLQASADARLKISLCRRGTWAGIRGIQSIPEEAFPD